MPTYATLEERCDACQVYGGQQNPCLPRGQLLAYAREQAAAADRAEKLGRPRPEVWPCPRRFLDNDNALAWELLPLLATESVAFAPIFSLVSEAMEPDEALAVIRRIHFALGHPEFKDAKKDAERDAARRARAESK